MTKEEFHQDTLIEVGKGDIIYFWIDLWLAGLSFGQQSLVVFRLAINKEAY